MYRRLRKVIVLLCAGALFGAGVAGWHVYLRWTDPEMVRRLILEKAAERHPTAAVELEAVQGRLLGGLKLVNFAVHVPGPEGTRQEMLRCPAVWIHPDRERLLGGELALRTITLEQPVLRLRQTENGQWNFQDWLGAHALPPDAAIVVVVNDGIVNLKLADATMPEVRLTGVNLTFELRPPGEAFFKGSFGHNAVETMRVSGQAGIREGTWHVDLATGSPIDLAKAGQLLPEVLQRHFGSVSELRGLVEFQATVDGSAGPGFDWDATLAGSLREGALAHPRLPYRVSEAEAAFTASRRRGLDVSRLKLRLGPARAALSLTVPHWSLDGFEVAGNVWDIPFADPVYRVLPVAQQQTWDAFAPSGSFNLDGRLHFANGTWHASGALDVVKTAVTFYLFPYPVAEFSGRIELLPSGEITITAQGQAGDRPVTLSGRIADPSPGAELSLTIRGTKIPYDERLVRALKPAAAEAVRKFSGQATGDFTATITRQRGQARAAVEVHVDLYCTRVTWAPIPFLLEDVKGTLVISQNRTLLRQFVGRAQRSPLELDGQVVHTTEGPYVEITVQGRNVALDSTLESVLPGDGKRVWGALRPAGKAHFVCTAVQTPAEPIEVDLHIEPAGAEIRPVAFAWRLHDLKGVANYRQGVVSWEKMQARHGTVEIECSGRAARLADGGILQVSDVRVANLLFDEELISALPPRISAVVRTLQPSRAVDLLFRKLFVRWFAEAAQPTDFEYDGTVYFHQTDLVPRVGLKNVTGKATLAGRCTGEHVASGDVKLEGIGVGGFAATGVTAHVHTSGEELRFTRIQGGFYGGSIGGTVRVRCAAPHAYDATLAVRQARLEQYVRQRFPQSPAVGARVDADLRLFGAGATADRLNGTGKLQLSNADIWRSPIVLDLLDVLKMQAPDGQVFDTGFAQFRLADRTMFIDQFELTSPTLSLFSTEQPGQLNWDSGALDMRLGMRWARGQLYIPVFSETLNAASDQLLTVHVGGTISDPRIVPEPGSLLRRLFTEPFKRPAPPRR